MVKYNLPIIAVIDSGIGGVSVLKQIIAKFHCGNYIYYADNLYMPYGNKSKNFLKSRIKEIVNLLQTTYHCDKIIIACNTASSCIDGNDFKNVYLLSFNEKKTHLATPLTKKNLKNINIVADKTLAKQIEKYIFNEKKLDEICRHHIEKLKLENYKEIVLGCTHYELIAKTLKRYCKNTKIEQNSKNLIKRINITANNDFLNIKILLSKKSIEYESTILKLLII